MSKEIKYTSDNLFDVKCLRQNIYYQIEECNIRKRILDGQIEKLTEIASSLDRYISSIEKLNEEKEE